MNGRRVVLTIAAVAGVLTVNLAWLALFLAVAWLACALLWPFAPCRRCKGGKTSKGSTKRRFGLCGACGGSGSRQVLGSKTLHRAARSVAARRRKVN